MAIIDQLATTLNRRDEVPNIELAKQIVAKNDQKAVKELMDYLSNNSRDIQNDCIKVLYEIGERKPAMIVAYTKNFVELLKNKNNRLQWGAMSALDAITIEKPKMIYALLPGIIAAAESGTVITKDRAMSILITLCSVKQFEIGAFALFIEQLKTSFTNQLPMYAEKAMPIINEKNKVLFVKTLTARMRDIEKETSRKRVEKVIKKLTGK